MKTLFIEAKKKEFNRLKGLPNLPDRIGLFYTIQFQPLFKKIKNQLENNGKKVFTAKAQVLQEGQILGCNVNAPVLIEKKVDCFVLLSSGRWHALSLSLLTEKPIYIIENGQLTQLPKNEIESLKKKRKAAIAKFLMADKIGIVVSTKPGQNNLAKARGLKEKLIKERKSAFIFITDIINPKELENFDIQFWINTACPGLIFDIPNLINLNEYQTISKNIEKLK